MRREDRAKQFMPFDAMKGLQEALRDREERHSRVPKHEVSEKIAEKISQIINYPAEGSIGYPTPGSFGTYCGVERNIPTITLELDEEIQVQELVEPVFKIFDLLSITDW